MNKQTKQIVDLLAGGKMPEKEGLLQLIRDDDPETAAYLAARADTVRRQVYGDEIYIRGLIEFTNYCKNDCYYCGIRKSKASVNRYRLTAEEILACCRNGHQLGFRTFVLQGGEDPYWNDERLALLIQRIKENHPDCAVTLSVGERSYQSYQRLFAAGADRYLLRHETANPCHYAKLHPQEMHLRSRMACLHQLKEIGYQTGCGFMVGSPGQTADDIACDLRFLRRFRPEMAGIGPFLPAAGTPFAGRPKGSVDLTVKLLSIIRLMLPRVLLPATTALSTAEEDGQIRGILAGANVLMPNLSPLDARKKYRLYDDKRITGDEAAEGVAKLRQSMENIGFHVVTARGDGK